MYVMNFNETAEVILEHCFKLSILKKNAEEKKKKAIINSVIIAALRADMTLDDLKECILDVNNGKIIDCLFFKKGGNLFDTYINSKWIKFAKELFNQRSVGLGTPNAASGEGELMFLFLCKDIKKPKSGDLQIGNEIFELKGEGTRVMSNIRGSDFRKKTIVVCKEFNLIPNEANRTGLDAVEIEKEQHLDHWKKELAKLSLAGQKDFINKWLGCLDNEDHVDAVVKIFRNGQFIYNIFLKELVKILYSIMVSSSSFDKFIILGDGTNVKIIGGDVEDFNKRVDSGEIILRSDYFRINQDYPVGWYID